MVLSLLQDRNSFDIYWMKAYTITTCSEAYCVVCLFPKSWQDHSSSPEAHHPQNTFLGCHCWTLSAGTVAQRGRRPSGYLCQWQSHTGEYPLQCCKTLCKQVKLSFSKCYLLCQRYCFKNSFPIKPVASCCRKKEHIFEPNVSLLCYFYMLRISIECRISDVGNAGVRWFQFDAAGGRQPTGNSRFCSSLNSALLPFTPPSTVSAPN